MGYTTEFKGQISVTPPLNENEREFLNKFANTRRMDRKHGPYYVEGTGDMGQDKEKDVLDYNRPPQGQPSLWCQWVPNEDGTAIEWDGGEKFYSADDWMQYLIEHFIGSNPIAQKDLPFLIGHDCHGEIKAQGEDMDDRWLLIVEGNAVKVQQLV